MDGRCRLLWEFQSVEHLAEQIATNLRRGRAFIEVEHQLSVREQCELVLVHPVSSAQITLPAEAVYVAPSPQMGVGLEILESAERLGEQLDHFLTHQSHSAPSDRALPAETEPYGEPSDELLLPDERQQDSVLFLASEPAREDTWSSMEGEEFELDPISSQPSAHLDDDALEKLEDIRPPPSSQAVLPAGARVRTLNAAGRDRMARHGSLSERVALERAFGPAVWEALLSNPLLSTAEVSRIAKNHTVSQPILSTIVSNPGWLVKPEVRRALLSNPRLLESQIERTLRALPHSELRLVLRQTAYPPRVRNVAKRLLGA